MKVWSNIVQRPYARLGTVRSIVPFHRSGAAIKPLCDAGFAAVKFFARRNRQHRPRAGYLDPRAQAGDVLAGGQKIGEIDVHSSKLAAHLLALRASGQLAHF